MAFWNRKIEPIIEDGNKALETDSTDQGLTESVTQGSSANRLKYKKNGILQNIINSPAEDATREWFKIDIDGDDNTKRADAIQERMKELGIKTKSEMMIKFSRINKEGSGFFFGIDGGSDLAVTTDLSEPLPEEIDRIKFCNVLDNPDTFDVQGIEKTDPTKEDYGKIKMLMGSKEVNEDRFIYLVDNYDIEEEEGTSVVDAVSTAVEAQEEALAGTTNIFQRIGAVLFESPSNSLGENTQKTIATLLTFIKNNLKRNKAMALKPGDKASMLSYAFSGLKDAYDYVKDNLAAMAKMPLSIIFSGLKGGIVTGDGNKGELMNYYRGIEGYQETRLEPLMRKTINLILKETKTEQAKIIGSEPITYTIVWNALWSMTQQDEATVNKTNSERDKTDWEAGKASGDELRQLDPRFKDMGPMTGSGEEEIDA